MSWKRHPCFVQRFLLTCARTGDRNAMKMAIVLHLNKLVGWWAKWPHQEVPNNPLRNVT